MFTGIVATVGSIVRSQVSGGDLRLRIATAGLDLDDVGLGDSIATNGVCLTVTRLEADGFWADVSNETLAHSTLGALPIGAAVNLEKALRFSDRLGGHLVSGHVDGVGVITGCREDGRSRRLRVEPPKALARYIVPKGSICVDGVSLTVNAVGEAGFELNVVPHTAASTVIAGYRPGQRVNLEVDMLARYLERLLSGGSVAGHGAAAGITAAAGDLGPAEGGLTIAALQQAGFLHR